MGNRFLRASIKAAARLEKQGVNHWNPIGKRPVQVANAVIMLLKHK